LGIIAPAAAAGESPRGPSSPQGAGAGQETDEKKTPDEASSDAENNEKKDAEADKKPDSADEKKADSEKEAGKDDMADDAKKDEAKKEEAASDATKETEPAKSDKPAAKPEAKKRKTFKVEPKRLKIDLALDGVFVASKTTEVPFRPEAWTDYEIVEAADLGAKVHKGEVLFKFDDKKINEAISDLELEQRLSELAILRAEEELPRMEKSLKMDFDDAERSNREAKEDFARYNEIDRPLAIKSAEFMIKYYNFNLDYEKDELEQLEKMYKADDLTEETEEIVLKRQRNSVEFAEFSLENAKVNSEEMLKIRIPRMDIQIKESLERAALALARAQTALSLDLNRARYEQEQRKKGRTKSLDRHAKLLADRALMEIKSPADGVVFYGQAVNGRWAETPTLINKYKPHSNVSPGSILATIVEPRPLSITSQVDEAKRPEVADGQKAKVALPADGTDRVPGDVKSISPIPVAPGKFEINFNIDQDKIPDWIVAGMSCKVHVNTYDKEDALVVPKKAVHDDKDNPDEHYVWVVDPDDEEAKPERRVVKLGKKKDEEVEIVKGLKKDEVISLDDEDAKKKEEEAKKKEEK
jgi:multidrug resistance efflux pump